MNHWINKIFFTLILLLSGCDKTDKTHNTALVTGFYNTPLFIGKVRAIKQQPVQSPTDGMIIEVIHYPGQTINKGDVIAKIESEEAGKRVLSNLSKKQSLETKYQQVKRKLEVYQELLNDGAISQNEFTDLLNQKRSYEFEKVEIKHQLNTICPLLDQDLCQKSLETIEKNMPLVMYIRAPADGVITAGDKNITLTKGMQVKQNQALAEIADMSSIATLIEVNDKEANDFKPGTKVKMGIPSSRVRLNGIVQHLQPIVGSNDSHNQFQVYITATPARNHVIRLGAKANIELPPKGNLLLVPKIAVFHDQQRNPYVQKILSPQKQQTVPINITEPFGKFYVVTGNLQENDQLLLYDNS